VKAGRRARVAPEAWKPARNTPLPVLCLTNGILRVRIRSLTADRRVDGLRAGCAQGLPAGRVAGLPAGCVAGGYPGNFG